MSDIKTRILLPKGRAMEACTAACEQELDVELPRYDGTSESSKTKDYDIFWLKPKDIGGLILKGLGDLGSVGSDVTSEYLICSQPYSKLDVAIPDGADPMCRFSVLGRLPDGFERINQVLNSDARYPANFLYLPTAYPRLLTMASAAKDLPFKPYPASITGCVEVYAEMVGAVGVADLIQTGNTAARNGLAENIKLMDIYPEIITRAVGDETI